MLVLVESSSAAEAEEYDTDDGAGVAVSIYGDGTGAGVYPEEAEEVLSSPEESSSQEGPGAYVGVGTLVSLSVIMAATSSSSFEVESSPPTVGK